jgi:hypothetical protein
MVGEVAAIVASSVRTSGHRWQDGRPAVKGVVGVAIAADQSPRGRATGVDSA